jgi:hypothetical protein
MAGGGYRGILAAVPPAQRLRSASGKGAADLKPKRSNGKGKGKGKGKGFASRLAPTMDPRTAFNFHHPQWCGVPLLILTTHQAER